MTYMMNNNELGRFIAMIFDVNKYYTFSAYKGQYKRDKQYLLKSTTNKKRG